MSAEQTFSVANTIALFAWVLMLAMNRQRWVLDTLIGCIVPAMFAAIYTAIVVSVWRSSSGGFSSLAGVAALFGNRWLLLAGWIHYLAFDLLIGRWELIDARGRGIPLVIVAPCLFVTFMFGPAGWLLYTIVRLSAASRGAAAPAA